MKEKTDRLLLLLFLLSTVLCILAVLVWLELIPDFGIPISIRAYAALVLSAFPALFLQLLLCRKATRRWVKALPALILWALVMVCFIAFLAASGWDSLGWLLLLILCIPLAAGIFLGLLTDRVLKKFKK